jgi:hypothetical protein
MQIFITDPCLIRQKDKTLAFVGPEGHPAFVAVILANASCAANRNPDAAVMAALAPFPVIDEEQIEITDLVAF